MPYALMTRAAAIAATLGGFVGRFVPAPPVVSVLPCGCTARSSGDDVYWCTCESHPLAAPARFFD